MNQAFCVRISRATSVGALLCWWVCLGACSNGGNHQSEQAPARSTPARATPTEAAVPVSDPEAAKPAPATPAPPAPPPAAKAVPADAVQARALVATLAPGDPLRIAVHWPMSNTKWTGSALDLNTLQLTLAGPAGTQTLRPDPSALKTQRWSRGTLILQLDAAGMTEKYVQLTAPWLGSGPEYSAPGSYSLVVSGERATVHGGPPRVFQTAPIALVVSAERPPLAELEQVARARLALLVPELQSKPEILIKRWTESGFVPDIAIETEPGKVRFRYATRQGFKWGYDLHSITVGVDRSVLGSATKEIDTCIAAGVLVDGEHGPRAIESIAVGERIFGYDVQRARRVLVTVRAIHQSEADAVLQLGALRVTGNHPVYVDGRWQEASAIRPGAGLLGADGALVKVAEVSHVAGPHTVYTLTVDSPHNYFAGGVLVHNKDRGYNAKLDDPWLFMWDDDPGW